MRNWTLSSRLKSDLIELIGSIYPQQDSEVLLAQIVEAFWSGDHLPRRKSRTLSAAPWSEKDSYLIAYGNSIVDGEHKPLDLLHDFLLANLKGVVNGVQAFLPGMLAAGRSSVIVNTGSKQGLTNPPGNPAYNTSKAAVRGQWRAYSAVFSIHLG